jgi:hypothetical protein
MSLVHFASGIGVSLLIILLFENITKRAFFISTLLMLIIWEFFEASLRLINSRYPKLRKILDFLPFGWFTQESFLNIIGDIIVGFLGILVVYFIFI